MLQYAAQGAAQALEDACALADACKKHTLSNIEAVFCQYEQERIPLTSRIVHFARTIGHFAHQNGEMKIVRDQFLRMHYPDDFNCVKWMYKEKRTEN